MKSDCRICVPATVPCKLDLAAQSCRFLSNGDVPGMQDKCHAGCYSCFLPAFATPILV